MTDDAELRARIEAQVAARRAGSPSSKTARPPVGDDTDEEGRPARKTPRGSRSLTPTRPWSRPTEPTENDESQGSARAPEPPASGAANWRGIGPARPWAGSAPQAPVTEPGEAADESADDAPSAGGRLRPARPWHRQASAGEPVRPDDEPAGLAPSHPDNVLRALTDETEGAAGPPQPPSGRLRHRFSGRHPDTRAEPTAAPIGTPPAGSPHSAEADGESTVPASYVPDESAVTAFADAAAPMLESTEESGRESIGRHGRRRRDRRRMPPAMQPRHAATVVPADDSVRPADLVADTVADAEARTDVVPEVDVQGPAAQPLEEGAPPPAVADTGSTEPATDYPWMRKEDVDLDLHGAPTWDPAMYPPEPDVQEQRRGRRALRWLLTRAPEPVADEEPPQVADREPTAPAEYEPVATEPARAVADELDAVAPVGETADDEAGREGPAADSASEERHTSVMARLLGRRHVEDEEEEDEQFELPEPDAAFEQPWLKVGPPVPRPTRDWNRPGATDAEVPAAEPAAELPPVAEPEVVAEPEFVAQPEAMPEPIVEPVAVAEPEAVPAAEPMVEPLAETEPEATSEPEAASGPVAEPAPVSVKRRPTPGPAGSAAPRPLPGPNAQPAQRPSPGPAGAASRTPLPFELAAGTGAGTTALSGVLDSGHPLELAGGLASAEPQADKLVEAEAEAEAADDRRADRRRWRRLTIRLGVTLLIAVLAAVVLRVFVVQPYYIPSESMEPTLRGCVGCNDDHVLVDKFSYRLHDPRVSDIVVFHRPKAAQGISENVLIKRVVALGGDKVAMKKGRLYVNGLMLDEGYLNSNKSCYATSPLENFPARTVPKGDVFVMGDNRCDSIDSRSFGAITKSSIIGRAFAVIWPFHRIKLLH